MNFCIFGICAILLFVIFSFQIYSEVNAKDEILIQSSQDNKYLKDFDNNNLKINELNSIECVHSEESENVEWFSKIPLLPIVVTTSNSIPEGGCKRQLDLYLKHLKNGTLWASEMFDASAKYPYGIFDGLNRHLGSFDQCIRIQTTVNHNNGELEEIRSRYCLVEIKYEEKNEPSTSTEKLAIFFHPQDSAWKAIREKGDFRRFQRYALQMALCFPAGCKPEDIVDSLKEPLEKFGTENNVQVNVSISPKYCNLDPMKDIQNFSNYEILFYVVCILVIALVIVSTIYEKNSAQDKERSFSRELLSCFDARKNLDDIFKVSHGHRGLDSIHFVRFVIECFAVLGHRQILFMIGGNISGIYFEWIMTTSSLPFLHNGTIIINAFFGMGGLLMSYSLLKNSVRTKNLTIVRDILKRIFRLTPLYMFITFAYATVFYHVGSGPYWEATWGLFRHSCNSYWWANLFYINNYIDGPKKCIIQSWYLAVDFQCYLIGLLLMSAFYKLPRKIGYVFLSSALLFAMAVSFYMTFINNISPIFQSFTQLQSTENSEYFLNYYVKTYVHLSSYIVGLICGAFIYDYKHATWRISKYWANFVCVPLTIALLFGTEIMGNCFVDPNVETTALQKALYASIHRPMFALGICFVPIFLTICEGLDFYYNLMTPRWVQPISKLSYGIYLIHFAIQHFETGALRTSVATSFYNAVKDLTSDMIYSICLSIFLVLIIEYPFRNLGDLCLRRKNNLKTPVTTSDTSKKKKMM